MSISHWATYHDRWARLTPPLRPNREITDAVKNLLGTVDGPVLLLGVTPEFADLAPRVVAADSSDKMIAAIWPGDTENRRAIKANWLDLPFADGTFSAVIGDGSLNTMQHPSGYAALFGQLARKLQSGGRIVLRVFMAPDHGESLSAVREATLSGAIKNFHAFKWRLAMAIVAGVGNPNIKVATILENFERAFPDRAALSQATGWSDKDIDTIDVYRGSAESYSFPTFDELCATVPEDLGAPRHVAVGTYALAERCPLIVLDRQ